MKGRVLAVVLVVLAVVAAVVWFALREAEPSADPATDPTATGPAADVKKEPPAKPKERLRAGRKWVALGEGEVRGRVLEYGTEKPLAGVAVSLTAGAPGPDRTIEVRAGDDGSFRFPDVPDFDDWTVRVDAPVPLADLEQAGVSVIEGKTTDLGVLYVTPGFSVPGIVVDERGDPIEGAEVRILRPRPAGARLDILRLVREIPTDNPAVDRATSAKDGKFALTKTSPGMYDVKVVRSGRQVLVEKQVVVNPDTAKRPLRFVMSKGFAIDGKVTRKTPGAVAGIPVVAFREPQGEFDFLVLDRAYGSTDEEGKFHVDGLGAGRYIVTAAPEGEPFALADNVDIPATTWIELVIEGDAWIEGRVTGRGGAPVAAAHVFVAAFEDKPTLGSTQTAADGRYAIRGLRSGKSQVLLVQAEGYAMYPADLMSVFQGGRGGAGGDTLKPGRNERDIALEAGGIVKGVVVASEDEKPIEGVRVEVLSAAAIFGGSRGATTDAQGKFEITGAPMGASILTLSKEGWFQPGMGQMALMAVFNPAAGKQKDSGKGFVVQIGASGDVVERTLSMARGSTIVGRVVAPDGTPVAGARVQLRPEGDGGMFDGLGIVMGAISEPRLTDGEGRYEVAGPQPGTKARVTAKSPGWLEGRSEPLSAGIGAKIEGIDVRLRVGASVEGRITDSQGRPLEGVAVRWLKAEGLNEWEVPWRLRQATPALTDADGRYKAANVEPGKVIVEASHAKYLKAEVRDLETAEGKSASFEPRLTLGAVIPGKVNGPDGRPFANATVVLDHSGSSREGAGMIVLDDSESRRVTTGADGTFLAEGLQPGAWSLHAEAKGCAPSEAVAVTAAAGTPAVTLRLQPALRIAGTVRVGGAVPGRVQVTVQKRVETSAFVDTDDGEPVEVASAGGGENWRQVESEVTGTDGKFLIEDLPAGNYRVVFTAASWGENRANILPKTLDDVAAGSESLVVELSAGFVIRGTVTLEDGTPAPQGWVNANQVVTDGKPLANPVHAWCQVESGGFELVGLPEGTFEINVQVPDHGRKHVRAEAGTTDLRVVIGAGGKIRGRVVREDGTPAPNVWVSASGPNGGDNENADLEGNYTIGGLEPGTYKLGAWSMGDAGGQLHGEGVDVEVRANDTVDAPQIVLRAVKQEE